MLRTSNPTLGRKAFQSDEPMEVGERRMTVDGTVNRTLVLLVLLVSSAVGVWVYATAGTGVLVAERAAALMPLAIGGVFGGLVLALLTMFNKRRAGLFAPMYALVEGLVIGALTSVLEVHYPGIALQAGALTMLVLFSMLGLYKTGLIKVTAKFRAGVLMATSAIMMFYLLNFVMSMFGASLTGGLLAANPGLSIGLSVVFVVVASLNLLLDFDRIERGAEGGAPQYMEWYGAFALTVTLVWLYLEILNLLAKLRRR